MQKGKIDSSYEEKELTHGFRSTKYYPEVVGYYCSPCKLFIPDKDKVKK